MSRRSDPQADMPTLEELEADPEIAALLDFEPVERKIKGPKHWSPELQREFIARLAACGAPSRAVRQMGKYVNGIEQIYKGPDADSFRDAWDRAIEIGHARAAQAIRPVFAGRPPGVERGWKPAGAEAESASAQGDDGSFDAAQDERLGKDNEPELDEAEKLALIERLAVKFLKKVVAEREARLAGEVVAADFYLRQVTALEVIFDLLASPDVGGMGGGMDAWEHLKSLQRGGHTIAHIVDTPFARYLDDKRREYWAASGEPMRPVTFAEEFLRDHGDHRTAVDQNGYGACTTPARGYSAEAWAQLDNDQQRDARRRQFEEDAAAQVEWERRAHEAWEASEHGAQARAEFEQSKNRSS